MMVENLDVDLAALKVAYLVASRADGLVFEKAAMMVLTKDGEKAVTKAALMVVLMVE